VEVSTLQPPPPERPELPDGVRPRWPAWYAGAGFLVALIGTLLAVGIIAAAFGVNSTDDDDPSFTILATFAQSLIFIGTAVLFASFTSPPRPWHFGLRRTPLWPAVGWATLGVVSFYFAAAVYSVIVQPDAEQTVAQDLGADEGTIGLIVAGFMVVCIAPVAEEFFFRGFFYRALRSRWSVLTAALIDGVLFGAIHWDFSGEGALILPPLALLGFMFCLVYERTGSIFPVIALHALNNAIAYGVAVDDASVSLVFGPLMLVACAAVPGLMRPAPALR
jgi:uncharacterized protein